MIDTSPAALAKMGKTQREGIEAIKREPVKTLALPSLITNADREKAEQYAGRQERKLQGQFASWLQLHDILYYRVPMHKKSAMLPGYSDFTVWLPRGITLYMELKVPGGVVSDEQAALQERMASLGHRYCIRWSLEECIETVNSYL